MRRNLLITTATAALLAGTVFAAAQQGGRMQGGADVQGQGGASQSQGGATQPQGKNGTRTQGQGDMRTQGQGGASQGQADKDMDKSKAKSKTQRGEKKEQTPKTSGQGGSGGQQGERDQGKSPKQGQMQRNGSEGGKSDGGKQGQTQRNGNEGGKQNAQQKSGGSNVTLTTEQRTKIRTTVLQSSNAPRVTNVNFSIRVGTVVPRERVKLVTVSPILVEIHPQWRGYLYFIVDEEIIIVEPRSYKIVAVLEV